MIGELSSNLRELTDRGRYRSWHLFDIERRGIGGFLGWSCPERRTAVRRFANCQLDLFVKYAIMRIWQFFERACQCYASH